MAGSRRGGGVVGWKLGDGVEGGRQWGIPREECEKIDGGVGKSTPCPPPHEYESQEYEILLIKHFIHYPSIFTIPYCIDQALTLSLDLQSPRSALLIKFQIPVI